MVEVQMHCPQGQFQMQNMRCCPSCTLGTGNRARKVSGTQGTHPGFLSLFQPQNSVAGNIKGFPLRFLAIIKYHDNWVTIRLQSSI